MILKGKVVKLGDKIDTDVILPGKYLTLVEPLNIKNYKHQTTNNKQLPNSKFQ